jgi:hypothetical protein
MAGCRVPKGFAIFGILFKAWSMRTSTLGTSKFELDIRYRACDIQTWYFDSTVNSAIRRPKNYPLNNAMFAEPRTYASNADSIAMHKLPHAFKQAIPKLPESIFPCPLQSYSCPPPTDDRSTTVSAKVAYDNPSPDYCQ